MSAYSLEEISRKWRKGTLTSEQAIGQLLQVVVELNGRVGVVEKKLVNGSASKTARGVNK
ncbi:MAG: hypothetical protein AAF490_12355 [Chloroflexota bacterium]